MRTGRRSTQCWLRRNRGRVRDQIRIDSGAKPITNPHPGNRDCIAKRVRVAKQPNSCNWVIAGSQSECSWAPGWVNAGHGHQLNHIFEHSGSPNAGVRGSLQRVQGIRSFRAVIEAVSCSLERGCPTGGAWCPRFKVGSAKVELGAVS